MRTAEIRIKLKQWGKKIIIFLLVILTIFVAAKIIAALVESSYNPQDIPRQEEIKNVYDTPIFGAAEVEEEKKTECFRIISKFVEYGNNKEYEQIYNMLTQDYKDVKMNDITKLKEYIDRYFNSQKGFSYQNIINNDTMYIYEVKIYDDLMLSGNNTYTSGNQNKIYFVINDKNGELKVSLDGFISKQNIEVSSQNEYMKFTILSKEVYYNGVKFNLKFENLTDNRVLTVYSDDIYYLLYNKNSEKITRYSNDSKEVKVTANVVMPKASKELSMSYNRYIGASNLLDYRININMVYSYDLADYMEVLFDNPGIKDKAKETYSNIYISL